VLCYGRTGWRLQYRTFQPTTMCLCIQAHPASRDNREGQRGLCGRRQHCGAWHASRTPPRAALRRSLACAHAARRLWARGSVPAVLTCRVCLPAAPARKSVWPAVHACGRVKCARLGSAHHDPALHPGVDVVQDVTVVVPHARRARLKLHHKRGGWHDADRVHAGACRGRGGKGRGA
jgi:hypothetical protein